MPLSLKTEWLEREDLIKRVVSMDSPFLDYYRNATNSY